MQWALYKTNKQTKQTDKIKENGKKTRYEQWWPLSFLLLSPVVLRISQSHR